MHVSLHIKHPKRHHIGDETTWYESTWRCSYGDGLSNVISRNWGLKTELVLFDQSSRIGSRDHWNRKLFYIWWLKSTDSGWDFPTWPCCEPRNMVFPELLKLKEAVGDKLKEKLVEIIIQAFFHDGWMLLVGYHANKRILEDWFNCKHEDFVESK